MDPTTAQVIHRPRRIIADHRCAVPGIAWRVRSGYNGGDATNNGGGADREGGGGAAGGTQGGA
eukprot:2726506-Rhodomonas_salina.2